MTGVHRGAEALRRPIGFEEVNRLAAVDQYVGLVAVDVIDVVDRVTGSVDRRRHLLERSQAPAGRRGLRR